jgi:hypothetical protein
MKKQFKTQAEARDWYLRTNSVFVQCKINKIIYTAGDGTGMTIWEVVYDEV